MKCLHKFIVIILVGTPDGIEEKLIHKHTALYQSKLVFYTANYQ